MNHKFPFPFIPAVLLAALSCTACVAPRDTASAIKLWGAPVAVTPAARTIRIAPDTRYVNVAGGETVNFVAGAESFAWRFDGPSEGYSFDLSATAPPGALNHSVIAYVDADPTFMGGR